MLTNKAVAELTKLCSASPATRKKKLGTDLAAIFEYPEVKKSVEASKLKQSLPPNLTEEQKSAIPPWLLELIMTLGPILLKRVLERLGIKL